MADFPGMPRSGLMCLENSENSLRDWSFVFECINFGGRNNFDLI